MAKFRIEDLIDTSGTKDLDALIKNLMDLDKYLKKIQKTLKTGQTVTKGALVGLVKNAEELDTLFPSHDRVKLCF